jgi:hypothetical protein
MTDFDTVATALVLELQQATALSYVPDENIVKRLDASETPGEYGDYAISVSLGGIPAPVNRLGGFVETTFLVDIKLFVKFAGAKRAQLVEGQGAKAGIGTFMRDVQHTLVQSTLGGVLSSPGNPLPGGAIQYGDEDAQTPTAKVVMTYSATIVEQKG